MKKATTEHSTAIRMLRVIQKYSDNENCKHIANKVLNGESTITEQLRYAGSFMNAVLNGDIQMAIRLSDMGNKIALMKGFENGEI